MGTIKIKEIKGNTYAYYVYYDQDEGKKEKYIGPVPKTSHNPGLNCPRCKMGLEESVLRKAIRNQLEETRDRMVREKEHITDYSTYAILEELLKAFQPSSGSD